VYMGNKKTVNKKIVGVYRILNVFIPPVVLILIFIFISAFLEDTISGIEPDIKKIDNSIASVQKDIDELLLLSKEINIDDKKLAEAANVLENALSDLPGEITVEGIKLPPFKFEETINIPPLEDIPVAEFSILGQKFEIEVPVINIPPVDVGPVYIDVPEIPDITVPVPGMDGLKNAGESLGYVIAIPAAFSSSINSVQSISEKLSAAENSYNNIYSYIKNSINEASKPLIILFSILLIWLIIQYIKWSVMQIKSGIESLKA
jgi:hypothetical protein